MSCLTTHVHSASTSLSTSVSDSDSDECVRIVEERYINTAPGIKIRNVMELEHDRAP